MNKHFAVILGGAAIAMAVSCSPSEKTTQDATAGTAAGTLAEPNVAEVRSAIEAANQKWAAAVVAGDLSTVIANYTEDAVIMNPMAPAVNGRAAYETAMKEWMASMKITEAKPTTTDVMVAGDLAIETGTFTMTSTANTKGAKPVTETGKYLTVWKRQADGGWKILRDINNSDGPPPTTK